MEVVWSISGSTPVFVSVPSTNSVLQSWRLSALYGQSFGSDLKCAGSVSRRHPNQLGGEVLRSSPWVGQMGRVYRDPHTVHRMDTLYHSQKDKATPLTPEHGGRPTSNFHDGWDATNKLYIVH